MSTSQQAWDMEARHQATQLFVGLVLREMHDNINALGGQPTSEYSRGVHETVAKALDIIEAKQAEYCS